MGSVRKPHIVKTLYLCFTIRSQQIDFSFKVLRCVLLNAHSHFHIPVLFPHIKEKIDILLPLIVISISQEQREEEALVKIAKKLTFSHSSADNRDKRDKWLILLPLLLPMLWETWQQNFKNQRQKLQLKEDRVKNEVNVAARQAEIIEMDVDHWLKTVEKELRDSQILEDEIDRIQCSKWCPNWGWRYSLCKKLAKKTLIISKLIETCNFSSVGRRAPLQGIEFITSKNFMDSESSKSALKEIMEAVNAEDVNMIGLSSLNDVAKEVADECKGLPLAIVTVAKALRGESLDGWRAANQRLKDSRHLDNEQVFGEVYKLLKFSYDYLNKNNSQTTENDIQSCFLLCSLFPEDYEIPIEMLIMCGIGMGLFSNAYSIEDKRREIVVALTKLQSSGLLLETDDGGRAVRMHDVVRDFAHWLTSMGENRFMVKDRLKEWLNVVDNFGSYTAIALWNCGCLNQFPKKVEFSKLKTLFLDGKGFPSVSSTNLAEMKALQVLFLKHVYFSLEGLQSLTNLRTLCFENCKLKNISSSLRNMRNLEVFSLFHTDINEILEELVELSMLKSLYIAYDRKQHIITFAPNLLSRLTALQELHVRCENNINLAELNSLSRLTTLSLKISTDQCFQRNIGFPRLQRYIIVVNGHLDEWQRLTFRTLDINGLTFSLNPFTDLFFNVEKLRLKKVSGKKNIIPSLVKNGANELTSLQLNSCHDMEFVIDMTRQQGPIIAFSNLMELDIQYMNCLKQLCHGPPRKVETQRPMFSNLTFLNLKSLPQLENIWKLEPSCHAIASLRNLKVVTVENCHKLKVIFSPCLAQSMVHLQQLYISNCNGLEQVIGFAQEEEITEIEHCCSLKHVFSVTLSQGLPWLESVRLKNCPQLIQVLRSTEERDIIGNHILLNVPFMRKLSVENCPKFTCFIVQSQLMEKLYLKNVGNSCQLCSTDVNQDCMVVGNREEVFRVQGVLYPFSNMKKLHLIHQSQVRIIWKELAGVVTLDNLITLRLYDCKKLRYIFSPSTARSLSQLANLYIMGCEELEGIILGKDQISSSSNGDTDLQPITFPNLTQIIVTDCNNLKSLFPLGSATSLQGLTHLRVERNSKLEQVFEVEDEVQVTTKEIKFDKLEWLKLEGLPSLVYFCPKGYHFVFPSLRDLKIKEYPRLISGFFIDSKQIVHSKTEATEGPASKSTPRYVRNKYIRWKEGWFQTLPRYIEE
ncbi:hypothetical protein V6N13_091292 [Hibiscus sabdariffa]